MDIKLHIANMSYIMMFETCHVMSDILRINMDKPTCGIHQPFVGRIFLGFPQPVGFSDLQTVAVAPVPSSSLMV